MQLKYSTSLREMDCSLQRIQSKHHGLGEEEQSNLRNFLQSYGGFDSNYLSDISLIGSLSLAMIRNDFHHIFTSAVITLSGEAGHWSVIAGLMQLLPG